MDIDFKEARIIVIKFLRKIAKDIKENQFNVSISLLLDSMECIEHLLYFLEGKQLMEEFYEEFRRLRKKPFAKYYQAIVELDEKLQELMPKF